MEGEREKDGESERMSVSEREVKKDGLRQRRREQEKDGE